jgi:ribosomal protein S18 acetylase RimI-like enzyme
MSITYRDATDADLPYVKATWAKSARGLTKRGRARDQFDASAREAVEILSRAIPITVACSTDHDTALLGWAAGANGKLVYVYVGREFRGHGIARELARRATST